MSASDYACMHLINNSTMHGIDVGQPTLCRGIDCLISSHSLLEKSRNDELRQISDAGAPVWSSVNPPSLRCNRSWGETPTNYSSPPSMLGCSLINAPISSFLVCFNDKHVPCGNLVTFCKYCWCIRLYLPLFSFLSCAIKPESFDMTRLSLTVQGTTRHIFHWRYRKYMSWGNEQW